MAATDMRVRYSHTTLCIFSRLGNMIAKMGRAFSMPIRKQNIAHAKNAMDSRVQIFFKTGARPRIAV
jgi:hypothetical protein